MCLAVTESEVRLAGLASANTEGDMLPMFVDFMDQDVRYHLAGNSNHFSILLGVRDIAVLLYVRQNSSL